MKKPGAHTVLINSLYPELLHPFTPLIWRNQSSHHRSYGTLLKVERSTDFITPVVPRMTLNQARCFMGENSLVYIPWKLGQITFNILGVFLDTNQLKQCLNIACTYEILVLRSSEAYFLAAFSKNPPYVDFRKEFICINSEDTATVLTERASAQFAITDAANILGWNADETFTRFSLVESKSNCK